MKQAVRDINPALHDFEASCFDGNYITGDVTSDYLDSIERARLLPSAQQDRDPAGDGSHDGDGPARSQLHLQLSA